MKSPHIVHSVGHVMKEVYQPTFISLTNLCRHERDEGNSVRLYSLMSSYSLVSLPTPSSITACNAHPSVITLSISALPLLCFLSFSCLISLCSSRISEPGTWEQQWSVCGPLFTLIIRIGSMLFGFQAESLGNSLNQSHKTRVIWGQTLQRFVAITPPTPSPYMFVNSDKQVCIALGECAFM